LKFGSLFQACFYFCLAVAIATLFINIVQGLNVFGNPDIGQGVVIGGNESNVFTSLTGLTGGFEYVWGLAVGLGLAGSAILAWATHSTIPIGVYLFGTLFWTSYSRLISVISIGDYIPADFLLGITVAMMFLFAGAVIGMLSGGG